MLPSIQLTDSLSPDDDLAILIHAGSDVSAYCQHPGEANFVRQKIAEKTSVIHVNQYRRQVFFLHPETDIRPGHRRKEAMRRLGADLFRTVRMLPTEVMQMVSLTGDPDDLLRFCEGFALSSYQFLKYKTQKKSHSIRTLLLHDQAITPQRVRELANVIQAAMIARDLVNEPVIYLTAEQFSKEISILGEHAGFDVEVFNKSKIRSLKMGGLLAVNTGSPNPPTFNVLEYKPEGARNAKPYVLVGKGVVYDTGGLSIKTAVGMETMKCDMAGGAAVAATLYALAHNNVPLHVVGLIPATENRLDGNALAPGDVITMHSGKTVEVLNTDAEGRLILADALSYATRYEPELVIDLATLTGAAARVIGKEGVVMMGTASEEVKKALLRSGEEVYERLVEFPLWEEYGQQLESDIADLKNIGGTEGGAITAGKFLEHFTSYPWLHLDIAAGAYLTIADSYRGKNATGLGVRLLYHFLTERAKEL
ncbi:MAG: leucyl aminopeptidase [Ferruginibacter sp.]|nr:leucyl aminopeptidase [Cytophagales bacterium]